jgi:hypothetical protein
MINFRSRSIHSIDRWTLIIPKALLLTILVGCQDGPSAPDYGPATGNARAFGIWTPGPNDDCTAAQHDAYSVVGPDRKRYPTWHPPTDPSGCSFGHDHGHPVARRCTAKSGTSCSAM